MEVSKLTICRQDVVISDAGLQSNKDKGSNKKKKLKNKVKCIRKVQLSTISVDRIVPLCYRTRCRRANHYHKITSKNNRHRDEEMKVKNNNNEGIDTTDAFVAELYSPITVESSSDNTHENINACGIKIISSDSDEIEELIKSTRVRMKQDKHKKNNKVLNQPPITTRTQANFDISFNEEDVNGSVHSMETLVLQNKEQHTSSALLIPQQIEANLTKSTKRNVNNSHNDHEIIDQDVPSPYSEPSNGNLSPLYEISGKVFMEHYLNTSII